MQWTNSGGGPLICGEKHVVARWQGLHGLSTESRVRNDYERACSTGEYLGRTYCGEGHVMVLGDEPLRSSFFHNDEGELAIARWVDAAAAEAIEQTLERSSGVLVLSPPVPFETTEEELVLLDSAWRGFETAGCQTANIKSWQYLVTTERLQSDGKFSFIVHRFVRSPA